MYKFYKHQNGLLEESRLYHMFFLFPLCFFYKIYWIKYFIIYSIDITRQVTMTEKYFIYILAVISSPKSQIFRFRRLKKTW